MIGNSAPLTAADGAVQSSNFIATTLEAVMAIQGVFQGHGSGNDPLPASTTPPPQSSASTEDWKESSADFFYSIDPFKQIMCVQNAFQSEQGMKMSDASNVLPLASTDSTDVTSTDKSFFSVSAKPLAAATSVSGQSKRKSSDSCKSASTLA